MFQLDSMIQINAAASICVIILTNADLTKDVTNDLICKNVFVCQTSVD